MKQLLPLILLLFILSAGLSSCGTLVGGSIYNANIVVENNTKAKIIYKGNVVGTGTATVRVKRLDANKFEFKVKEEGHDEQLYRYTSRSARAGAFLGTLLFTWPSAIPIPVGLGIDLMTGALFRPDLSEKGIYKETMNDYTYSVVYGDSSQIK